MQAYGLTTRVRDEMDDLVDAWKEATADGVICPVEQAGITGLLGGIGPIVAEQDDAMRTALSLLKVGFTPKVVKRITEHERLHPGHSEPPSPGLVTGVLNEHCT